MMRVLEFWRSNIIKNTTSLWFEMKIISKDYENTIYLMPQDIFTINPEFSNSDIRIRLLDDGDNWTENL